MQSPQPHPQPDRQPEKTSVSIAVILGAALVVVLALMCGVGAFGVIPTLFTTAPAHTPTHSSAVATQPRAQQHAAVLGGVLGDFVQRYGNSIDDSGQMYAATSAGQRVLIIVTLDDPRQSRDGLQHVIVIAVQTPGDALGVETWNAATADVIAQAFLPTDAQFQRTIITHGVATHIYHSETMAATIVPGQFVPENESGALSYYCHAWPPSPPPSGHASGYGQCLMTIGSA